MIRRLTEVDFDELSWHDCHLWGIGLRCGDPGADDWTSDLVLNIDYLAGWNCESNGKCIFEVAPATLVFHNVTDLKIAIDLGASGYQNALHELSIEGIFREPVPYQKVCLDRPYYIWRLQFNWPETSELSFGATGFTQSLTAEPIATPNQHLTPAQRRAMLHG